MSLRAAKDWGLSPSEWMEEPDWSKAKMIAMSSIEEEMKAKEYEDIKNKNSSAPQKSSSNRDSRRRARSR